jgi:hypothetical protein
MHLPVTFLFSIVHHNVERIHDQILLPPDVNSGERLPKLRDTSVVQTSPPEAPRPPEPPGKNAVFQIPSYALIPSMLRAMPMHH